jgi:hypothetical protein
MKRIAITQSNYIPWKGYFDMINIVDEFILFDDVQYTKRDWRNRNLIKTHNGTRWLTIPVEVKGKYLQNIKDTRIADSSWNEKHWKILKYYYSNSRWFSFYKELFEELYLTCKYNYISEINLRFILKINEIIGINTPIRFSSEFTLKDDKTERLISICEQTQSTCYLSGPAAKDYIKEEFFALKNIELEWMAYDNYNEYNQLHPPFIHQVSILDLLFNEGPESVKFLKSQYPKKN